MGCGSKINANVPMQRNPGRMGIDAIQMGSRICPVFPGKQVFQQLKAPLQLPDHLFTASQYDFLILPQQAAAFAASVNRGKVTGIDEQGTADPDKIAGIQQIFHSSQI